MHHQHEGTGRECQNIVLRALGTLRTASGADRPSQNKIGQILALPTSDFFNSLSQEQTLFFHCFPNFYGNGNLCNGS
jgi:hypothetical protein